MIPEQLRAIEAETIIGAHLGGFAEDKDGVYWYAGWIGDAPGDNPQDTVYQEYTEAAEMVRAAGFECGNPYIEHDYVSFRIVPIGNEN